MDDSEQLLEWISEGEHQCQDFKYRVSDAAKLARSVSAFANTDGGRLLIGVRDDGVISGVRSDEEIYMMHSAAMRYCRPAASIQFDTLRVHGKTVVVVTVPVAHRKPVTAPTEDGDYRAFVRVKDENVVASPVHLRLWHDEQSAAGVMLSYSDEESVFLRSMEEGGPLSLNSLVRRSAMGRYRIVSLLARLIRFGVVRCEWKDNGWIYSLCK